MWGQSPHIYIGLLSLTARQTVMLPQFSPTLSNCSKADLLQQTVSMLQESIAPACPYSHQGNSSDAKKRRLSCC